MNENKDTLNVETALKTQIDSRRISIHTDSYKMSVGELANLYREGDIEMQPAFQRLFRWKDEQKTKLIESLLLGIPIPSIFVFQEESGRWLIIDGLQRLSTIFQFMGILKSEEGTFPSFALKETEYLPALQDYVWNEDIQKQISDETTHYRTLEPEQQRLIKRAMLEVQIVTRESDEQSQLDLFLRLNTGGTVLTDQELRNAVLVMENSDFFTWYEKLSHNQLFKDLVGLTDRQLDEQYNMELVARFLLLKDLTQESLGQSMRGNDVANFLTSGIRNIARKYTKNDMKSAEDDFMFMLNLINEQIPEGGFKKNFKGKFSLAVYEMISIGVSKNKVFWERLENRSRLKDKLKNIYDDKEYSEYTRGGTNAGIRLKKLLSYAEKNFSYID